MSGVEIVGLVLGVWPVVLKLAKAYKAGRDGSSVKALANDIQLYEAIFKSSIRKLLQGDEDLSDTDTDGLLVGGEDFAALWKSPEFAARLERRLDKSTIRLLNQASEDISEILNKLKAKIEKPNDARGAAQPENIVQTSRSIIRGLRVSFQTTELNKLVLQLRRHVHDVRALLEDSAIPQLYSPGQQNSSRTRGLPVRPAQHRSLSGEQRRQFFDDFHATISLNYTCQCHQSHEANLQISNHLEIVFPVHKPGRPLSTSSFHMRPRSETLESQATSTAPTTTQDMDDDRRDGPRSTWSRPKSQSSVNSEYTAFPVKFNASQGVGSLLPIGDLCQWLNIQRELSPPNSPRNASEGVVGPGNKRYTVEPQARTSSATIVSMDDFLDSYSAVLTRRIRLELALNLASAIEHFHPTAWIDIASWTWRDFSMMREGNKYRLCITGRFWSVDSWQTRPIVPVPSKFWQTIRGKDPMLVRLGFALIELALGKRMSEIRNLNDDSEEDVEDIDSEWLESQKDMDDWITANDLLETNVIQDEVSPKFQEIIATCLQCEILEDTGVRYLKSGSATFEDDLDKFVVGPLREYYASIWGTQIAAV